MGTQSSKDNETVNLGEYMFIEQKQLPWTGKYSLLYSNNNPKRILKKTITFKDSKQSKTCLTKFYKQSQMAFYLIRPICIKIEEQFGLCASQTTLNIYHNDLLPNLFSKMFRESNYMRSETKIWFLLNEITHSLNSMHEKGYPHLWISPKTIFYNTNENWFLQDMLYWNGYDFQNLLVEKQKHVEQIISDHTIILMNKKQMIDIVTGFDEDVYCLGYTILYIMTGGVQLENLKINSLAFLRDCAKVYSKKLVGIVNDMIFQDSRKRISFERLRIKMKIDQENILHAEVMEFQKNKISMKRNIISPTQKSSRFKSKSPIVTPLQIQFEQKIQFYSPSSKKRKISQFTPRHMQPKIQKQPRKNDYQIGRK